MSLNALLVARDASARQVVCVALDDLRITPEICQSGADALELLAIQRAIVELPRSHFLQLTTRCSQARAPAMTRKRKQEQIARRAERGDLNEPGAHGRARRSRTEQQRGFDEAAFDGQVRKKAGIGLGCDTDAQRPPKRGSVVIGADHCPRRSGEPDNRCNTRTR